MSLRLVVFWSLNTLTPNNSAARCGARMAAKPRVVQEAATHRPSVFQVDAFKRAMVTQGTSCVVEIVQDEATISREDEIDMNRLSRR